MSQTSLRGRSMSQAPVRCALLAWSRFEWLCEACLHCPGLEVAALDSALLGLPGAHNPFALPTVRRADVMLVSSAWYGWLAGCHPERVEEVFSRLYSAAPLVVGVESHDELQLALPPEAVRRMACVLKGGGLYRDRELYNHEVGPSFPGGVWSELRRPRRAAYTQEDLAKLRLSIPCFLWVAPGARRRLRARRADVSPVRRLVRSAAERLLDPTLSAIAGVGRSHGVHCVGRLTHIQRLEAARLLEGLGGRHGITEVPERVSGLADSSFAGESPLRGLHEGLTDATAGLAGALSEAEPYWYGIPLSPHEHRALEAAALSYMRPPVSRPAFQLELRRHRVVVAVTGHGELTYRHLEALAAGAVLVCQDLRHAETMFPFADGENVLFCRPDLADLRATVERALGDARLRRRVGRAGRRTYVEWAGRWREHLREGIETPIRDAVTTPIRDAVALHTPFT
jgi:hypothetical protein